MIICLHPLMDCLLGECGGLRRKFPNTIYPMKNYGMKKIFTACLTVLSVFSLSATTPQTDGIVYKDKTKRFTVVSGRACQDGICVRRKIQRCPQFYRLQQVVSKD